jgi:hypothetical protein
MAFDSDTFVFGVKDCQIAKLLTDASPGPTFDPIIDVPGIQEFSFKPLVTEKKLKGDDKTIDIRTTIEEVEINVKNAKIPLQALEVILGGTYTNTGATPNQINKLAVKGVDRPHYFKIEAQVTQVDEEDADLHFVAFKAKLSSVGDLGAVGEDYKFLSFTAKGIPCDGDDSFFDIVENETETAIS